MNTISLGQKKIVPTLYLPLVDNNLYHACCFWTKQKKNDSGFFACDLTNTCIMPSVPKSKRPYKRDPWLIIAKILNVSTEQAKTCTIDQGCFAALVDRVVSRQCNSMNKITD